MRERVPTASSDYRFRYLKPYKCKNINYSDFSKMIFN